MNFPERSTIKDKVYNEWNRQNNFDNRENFYLLIASTLPEI